MRNLVPTPGIMLSGLALGLATFFASCTPRTHAPNAGLPAPALQAPVISAQDIVNMPPAVSAGPHRISDAEADLQQGSLTVWVPRTFIRAPRGAPAAQRYQDYEWEGLRREFQANFPNFDLQFKELELDEFIRAMHSDLRNETLPDVAFISSYLDVAPLLQQNAALRLWGESRLQNRGWWVLFRQARNFAGGESFLLWACQRFHWTPWSITTNTIGSADVQAVQKVAQKAVEAYAKMDAQSLGETLDPEAAHFEDIGRDVGRDAEVHTLFSVEPLVTFGNSRLALTLMAAVGAGRETFGMAHFGVILRKTEGGWKVWYFRPDWSLPELEGLFRSFDRLSLEEAAGSQAVPKVTLVAPADHAQPAPSPRSEFEWSTVDAPLAAYIVETQISFRGREWPPSRIELVSPVPGEHSMHTAAPPNAGQQPMRWRVWAVNKAGTISASDWRAIDVTRVSSSLRKVSAPEGVAVVTVDPACTEWLRPAERGQPMIPPHVSIRYNPQAPGAPLASAKALTLVIATDKGGRFDSEKIPMTRAATGVWQAVYTPEGNYIPQYAIFLFEDEANRVDNNRGQYWEILSCTPGSGQSVASARAETYEGRWLAPGFQRAPDLPRAIAILKGDLGNFPTHYDDYYFLWRYELKLGGESPSAYQQVGNEVDAFISAHRHDPSALAQIHGFIGFEQRKLPVSVVERYRQAVVALPQSAEPPASGAGNYNYPGGNERFLSQMQQTVALILAELDFWPIDWEEDGQKKVQDYLAFAAKYPKSSWVSYAYGEALRCEAKTNDVAAAEAVFEKWSATSPDDPLPMLQIARFYVGQKTKIDRALELLDSADALFAKNPKHFSADLLHRERAEMEFLRGQAYMLLSDLPHARAHLEAAAQATPDNPKTLYALGEVREKMGDIAPALDAYLSAAGAPYQESSAAHDAYERLFVAQKLGTVQEAEQKILERAVQNTRQAAADYAPIAMNRRAPAFAFVDLSGKQFDAQAAKGKPTVLTFWSVWCGVCVAELPALQEFQKQHPEANMLAVEIGNTPEEVRAFLAAHNLPTLRVAVSQNTPPEFGISAYPDFQVIDRFGQIQFAHSGGLANLEAVLGKDLQALPAPD